MQSSSTTAPYTASTPATAFHSTPLNFRMVRAATTTLNILPGGRAGTQSIGGGVTAWGNSAVNMSGGIVEGDFMSFQGQSVLNLTGGIIGTQASFFGNAEAFIWGGDLVSGAFIAGDA